MTVNIGTRHCRSDAVTLSSPSPHPQPASALLLDRRLGQHSASTGSGHRPASAAPAFLPGSFLPSAFPRVSAKPNAFLWPDPKWPYHPCLCREAPEFFFSLPLHLLSFLVSPASRGPRFLLAFGSGSPAGDGGMLAGLAPSSTGA